MIIIIHFDKRVTTKHMTWLPVPMSHAVSSELYMDLLM